MRLADSEPAAPSKQEFADLVCEGVRRAGETRELVYDEERFRLTPAGENSPLMNLSNLYQEYCAAPDSVRAQVLKVSVRNWFADRRELPEAFEDVRPDLLPSVRSRSYSEFTRLELALEGPAKDNWPLCIVGEHLAVGLVYDLPDSMRHIQQHDLDSWGITYYEALEAARENLAELPFQCYANPEQGVYISATRDNYDASRLILLDLIRRMEVRGEHVALVPNRDTLLVTGSEDEDGLDAISQIAEKTLEQPRPISGFAFRLEGDDWAPWLPSLGHPSRPRFHKLYVQSLGQEYAEQKDLLDKLHEKRGTDLFVASFNVIEERQTGLLSSYCLWADGVETLLPRSERVIFFRPDHTKKNGEIVAYAEWSRMRDVLGDLLETTDDYPERYLVRDFPTATQLESLGKLS
jgi:hypothetical protein